MEEVKERDRMPNIPIREAPYNDEKQWNRFVKRESGIDWFLILLAAFLFVFGIGSLFIDMLKQVFGF